MLGSSISAASVKEGEDIYLECGVQVGLSDDDDGDFDDNYHGDGDLESGQRWSMSNM